MHKPKRLGTKLATKFMAVFTLTSTVVLLTGVATWWILRSIRHEIETLRATTNDGNLAAITDSLAIYLSEARLILAASISLGIIFLIGLYLYLTRTIVRPLQINNRLLNRLAVGDGSEDVPANQLERSDEIGDQSRAIRDVIAYQREEVSIANDISAGNFRSITAARIPPDALGLAIRRMANVAVETFRRVNAHIGQVLSGCESISSASGEVSVNSADITAAIPEISTGIAEIRAHADGNADMAEQAGRLATTNNQSVERGYEDIGEMGMVMLKMQACGDKIVKIAKSISDIAFQTSLLSLNASVEAARAGRHGKGFTIVAEEVRSLAVRSNHAAEETSNLMKETVEQVELAAAIAGRINATFADMQTNMQEAEALLSKIATSSRVQSGGVDQISAALQQVDQSARENMDHVDGVLEKSDALIRQTGSLRQIMRHFRVDFEPSADSDLFVESDAPRSHARAIGTQDRKSGSVDAAAPKNRNARHND